MTKPSLGIYTPLPGAPSGLADYSQTSVRHLDGRYQVAFVSMANYTEPTAFDHVLYHIGCGRDSVAAYHALRTRSGPVVLHEHILSQFFVENHDLLDRDTNATVTAAFNQHLGERLHPADLHALMNRRRQLHYADLGLERLIVDRATTVFTHSPVSLQQLRQRYGPKVQALEFPAEPLPARVPSTRCELGIGDNTIVFGSFGFAGSHKRLPQLLRTWASLDLDPRQACLLIVGKGTGKHQHLADDSTVIRGYVANSAAFRQLLADVDVGIQLRGPTLGETSGVVAQLLASDIPVIVSSTSVLPFWANHEMVAVTPPDQDESIALAEVVARWLRRRPVGTGRVRAVGVPGWCDSVIAGLEIAAAQSADRAHVFGGAA